jgi:L-alanine-DL-glutamate epimerase-like enolase superfamily enzyme
MPDPIIRSLICESLAIPFKVAFRHASAERAETSTLWVRAIGDGVAGEGESCPRPYVTGESIESARAFFEGHEASLRADVRDRSSLQTWMDEHREEIDRNPAAWCAIELAILDLMARHAGRTIESFLGLPPLPDHFQYTAVLGDMGADAFRAMSGRYVVMGFTDFKVKVSGDLDHDRDNLAVLRQQSGIRIRLDANNLWRTADEAVAFLRALETPLFAVEEPIAPGQCEELARIAQLVGCRIVLDESLARSSQVGQLASSPSTWIVNLRVSKMGGLLRSLAVADAVRAAGVGLIVGAQVGETSLLTRVALTVAAAGRDVLVAQEGAFGTLLLERDVCDPPLMFGAGGVLETAAHPMLVRPGFGLSRADDPAAPVAGR